MVQTFEYKDNHELLCSLLPSVKYKITPLLIMFSTAFTAVSQHLGLNEVTLIAFAVLCAAELIIGIYTSIFVLGEKAQSTKASRFIVKLAAILVILFVLHSFCDEFKNDNSLATSFFEWLYLIVFSWSACEYLISILENLNIITGNSNNALINAIRKKLNKIFDIENEALNTDTDGSNVNS